MAKTTKELGYKRIAIVLSEMEGIVLYTMK